MIEHVEAEPSRRQLRKQARKQAKRDKKAARKTKKDHADEHAGASGDHNPIHIDIDFATRGPCLFREARCVAEQYLVVAGSVQTDKTMESMQEIMREYEEFVTTRPANEEEVERVKLNRMRSLPGTFSTNPRAPLKPLS